MSELWSKEGDITTLEATTRAMILGVTYRDKNDHNGNKGDTLPRTDSDDLPYLKGFAVGSGIKDNSSNYVVEFGLLRTIGHLYKGGLETAKPLRFKGPHDDAFKALYEDATGVWRGGTDTSPYWWDKYWDDVKFRKRVADVKRPEAKLTGAIEAPDAWKPEAGVADWSYSFGTAPEVEVPEVEKYDHGTEDLDKYDSLKSNTPVVPGSVTYGNIIDDESITPDPLLAIGNLTPTPVESPEPPDDLPAIPNVESGVSIPTAGNVAPIITAQKTKFGSLESVRHGVTAGALASLTSGTRKRADASGAAALLSTMGALIKSDYNARMDGVGTRLQAQADTAHQELKMRAQAVRAGLALERGQTLLEGAADTAMAYASMEAAAAGTNRDLEAQASTAQADLTLRRDQAELQLILDSDTFSLEQWVTVQVERQRIRDLMDRQRSGLLLQGRTVSSQLAQEGKVLLEAAVGDLTELDNQSIVDLWRGHGLGLRAENMTKAIELAQADISSRFLLEGRRAMMDKSITTHSLQAGLEALNNARELRHKDLYQKEQAFRRQYYLDKVAAEVDWRMALSSGIVGSYEQQWKSMLQNLMVVKEGLAAVGAAPVGTIHTPSGFQKVSQGVSGILGLVSTGINMGMALA